MCHITGAVVHCNIPIPSKSMIYCTFEEDCQGTALVGNLATFQAALCSINNKSSPPLQPQQDAAVHYYS